MIGSVEFNGLTILSESKKENVSGRVSMNVWIFPGENKIKVKGIHKRKKDESAPYLTATLYLAQKEQPYNEGRKIADFEWGEVEGKPSLPFEQEITFSPLRFLPASFGKLLKKSN